MRFIGVVNGRAHPATAERKFTQDSKIPENAVSCIYLPVKKWSRVRLTPNIVSAATNIDPFKK